MNRIIIPVTSITVGISDLGIGNGDYTLPTVSMNFPEDFADLFVQHLLTDRPEANQFYLGIGGKVSQLVEVAIYYIAEIPCEASFFSLIPGLVEIMADSLTNCVPVIIGNEADLSVDTVKQFLELQRAIGKYYIVCGYDSLVNRKVTQLVGDWRLEMKKVSTIQEVQSIIMEKVI